MEASEKQGKVALLHKPKLSVLCELSLAICLQWFLAFFFLQERRGFLPQLLLANEDLLMSV